MKWSVKQLQGQLRKPVEDLPAVILVFGDDGGAVRQYAQAVIDYIGVDLDDPFAGAKISVEDIQNHAGALLEAATTISFGGGLRLVKLEGVNGSLPAAQLTMVATAVKECLKANLQNVVIVIPAQRVGKDTALARAVERAKTNAAAVRCFQDTTRDVQTVVREFMNKAGRQITADAVAFMAENLGADREITLRELEKLVLYAGEGNEVTLEHCLGIVAGAPATSVFKLCDAVGLRDTKSADKFLNILQEQGEDLNMVFSLVVRHLRRVLQTKEAMEAGMDSNSAMRTLTPPVMFGQDVFMRQVNMYPLARLKRIASTAVDMQLKSRQGLLPAELTLARGILSLSV